MKEEVLDTSTETLQEILRWGVEDYICTKQRVEALIRAVLAAREESDRLGELLMETNRECNDELERVIDLQDMVQELGAAQGNCCLIEGRCSHGEAGFIHDAQRE